MEQLINYIKPELLVLLPVLYFTGMAAKQSEGIKDKHIPLLVGAAGVLLAVIYVLATSAIVGWQAALMAIFVALTQGILCAGCSVYINQLIKQSRRAE